MIEYFKLLGCIFLLYVCVYSIVNRICKSIEWANAAKMSQSGRSSDRREGNKGV